MLFDPKTALTSLLFTELGNRLLITSVRSLNQFAPDLGVSYWPLILLHEGSQFVSAAHELKKQDSLDGAQALTGTRCVSGICSRWSDSELLTDWLIDWLISPSQFFKISEKKGPLSATSGRVTSKYPFRFSISLKHMARRKRRTQTDGDLKSQNVA